MGGYNFNRRFHPSSIDFHICQNQSWQSRSKCCLLIVNNPIMKHAHLPVSTVLSYDLNFALILIINRPLLYVIVYVYEYFYSWIRIVLYFFIILSSIYYFGFYLPYFCGFLYFIILHLSLSIFLSLLLCPTGKSRKALIKNIFMLFSSYNVI